MSTQLSHQTVDPLDAPDIGAHIETRNAIAALKNNSTGVPTVSLDGEEPFMSVADP